MGKKQNQEAFKQGNVAELPLTSASPVAQAMSSLPFVMSAAPADKLSEQDKLGLDLLKAKQEIAREKARSAMMAIEVADQQYQNFILTLAMRYQLADGDVIEENGSLTRKGR
jgi:hypothetical protein